MLLLPALPLAVRRVTVAAVARLFRWKAGKFRFYPDQVSQRYFQGSEQTLISNQLLAQTMQSACLGHVPFDTSAGRVAQPTPSVRHCARTHPPHVRAHPLAGGHLFALRDAWAAYRTSCAGDVLTTAFPLVRSPRAAIYNDTVADRGEQSGDCPAALLPRGRCALSAKRLRET